MRLIVKPNQVPLGRRIAVIVTGLKPNEQVRFGTRPTKAGFGGGNLGTHRAGKDGTILFSYPAFTQRWELGTWVIIAQRADGTMLQIRLQVVEQPTAVPTPVYPALAPVQRWRLLLSARSYTQPAIAGNTVAYATTACGTCGPVLRLRSLASKQSRTIAQFGRDVSLLQLQLSPTWLVWLEGHYPRAGWQLWAWNRQTGRRHLVDSSTKGGGIAPPSFPEMSVSGNALAWVRYGCSQQCTRPGPSTLRLADLRGGTASVISHTMYVCRQIAAPSFSDTVLSWVGSPLSGYGCPAPNTWTIVVRDRRTGHIAFHEIHLSRNQVAEAFVGWGWREAWVEHLEYTNQDNRVVLMDLRSGTQRVIARQGAYSPGLTGRVLAWIGSYGDRIEALDLRTGQQYLLAHGTTGPAQNVALGTWLGQSWLDRVVWEESSSNPNGSIRDSLVVAAVP